MHPIMTYPFHLKVRKTFAARECMMIYPSSDFEKSAPEQ